MGCGKDEANADKMAATVPGKDAPGADKKGGLKKAESRGDEHSVYSLIDNRLSAHLHQNGGLVVPAGSAGFVKYMRFRKSNLSWKVREEADGKKVAVMNGKTGRIDVPLTAAQAKGEVVFRMHGYNAKKRALSLRVNGNQKAEISGSLAEGWATTEITVKSGLFKEGENEILIFTGKGDPMKVEWFQVGGSGTAPVTKFFDGKGLVLPRGGGLTYYITVPKGGILTGDLNNADCKVQVTADAEGGGSAAGTLEGIGAGVDLSQLAGKPARLHLTADGCAEASLANAGIVVPGVAKTVKRGAAPKYVVFWIMDSLRADRVRIFKPGAVAEVPTLEKIAPESAVFMHTYVQGNESRASHASIWTGMYPVKHGMITMKAKVASKWTTIDEVAKNAKMWVGGVSANGYVDKRWGFGTKWNKFQNHIHESKGLKGQNVFDVGMNWVDGKTDPWFLYIGSIDTHVTWRAKEPWFSKYAPAGYKGKYKTKFTGNDANNAAGGKLKVSDADIANIRALYDSNVSYQDELVQQLFDKLEAAGIADETMLIITADHGDEQWEADRMGHGGSLRETLVHVPLIIHYPPMFPGGNIMEGAEIVDVLPTLADALGTEIDPEWQGESLIPLAHGVGAGYARMIMSTQYEGSHAARIGDWKIRVSGSAKPKIFDLGSNPAEKMDVSDSAHIARRTLSDSLWLLRAYNKDWSKAKWGNATNVKPAFPADMGE
jgi:arylsulfatase A-like enzyme